jgi:hypothetical protein
MERVASCIHDVVVFTCLSLLVLANAPHPSVLHHTHLFTCPAGYQQQQQPQQGQRQQESYVLAGLLGNYGGGDD